MTDTFDAYACGDTIRYVGPEEFDGEWAAPGGIHGPYQFLHESMHGTLTLETCFKGRRYLSPDHPANDPTFWEVDDE